MIGRNDEELKELFGKFLNSQEADRAVEDVLKGEQILSEHPAPEPADELIAGIKAEIAEAVHGRRENVLRKVVYKALAVAAAVIILAAISTQLFEEDNGTPERTYVASLIPWSVWEGDDITADDADLATLVAEVEEIEQDLAVLQLGEDAGNGRNAVAELETELIEIESNFWKE